MYATVCDLIQVSEKRPVSDYRTARRKFRDSGWQCQPSPMAQAISPAHMGRQVISTRTGISFFTGIASSEGGSILKSDNVAGIVPADLRLVPLLHRLKRHILIFRCLRRKFDLHVAANARRRQSRFRQRDSHAHQWKLRTVRNLQHVKIPIGVARLKRLHRHCDQEIALSALANTLPRAAWLTPSLWCSGCDTW